MTLPVEPVLPTWHSATLWDGPLTVPGGGTPSTGAVFPFAPLPVVVEMWLGWWEGITNYVLVRDGITIRRGQADEASTPEPGSMTLTLNNRDGRFSPRNPTGPFYGLIGRNTPIRVRVELSDIETEDQTRFVGEISEWPSRWDLSGHDVWVPVTAQGILRRLGQGSSPVLSPMASAILHAGEDDYATPPFVAQAYWAMEDGASTTVFGSTLVGGSPLTVTTADFAADGTLPGSGPLPVFTATTALSGVVSGTFTDAWSVSWVAAFASTPASATTLMDIATPDGTAARWVLRGSSSSVTLTAYNTAGATVFTVDDGGGTVSTLFSGEWVGIEVYAREDVDEFGFTVYDLDGSGVGASDSTGALTAASVTSVAVPASSNLTDMAMGHLVASSAVGASWFLPTISALNALQAFTSEPAADRAERLCLEAGVGFTLVGDAPDTELMGPQAAPSTFADAFEETWQADQALLYETRDAAGLTFRTRVSLYNQLVKLTLDYDGAGEIAPNLEPTDDDQHVRNDVTVKRTNGSSARYVDSTSSLGTADPPSGVGRYDTEVEVNHYDDSRLLDHAGWRVHVGTWNEGRYPTIRVNLAALAAAGKTTLMTAVESLDVGDRLQLTDLPDWLPTNDVDLMVLGFEETIGHPIGWDITLICVPYGPWVVGVYAAASETPDPDEAQRYSPLESLVDATFIAGTDTSLVVEDQAGGADLWTTSNGLPFDIRVAPPGVMTGGVRLRVSAISAASGANQTMTVSATVVNGVNRSVPAGWRVSLWQPARYAL